MKTDLENILIMLAGSAYCYSKTSSNKGISVSINQTGVELVFDQDGRFLSILNLK